jgi:hypothetical protein
MLMGLEYREEITPTKKHVMMRSKVEYVRLSKTT